MKFADRIFRRNNVIVLSLRKAFSSKSDKVPELADEACAEAIDKELSETLASSAKHLAGRKVAQELNVECVPCEMCQGNKVGISSEEELTRSKYNFMVSIFSQG